MVKFKIEPAHELLQERDGIRYNVRVLTSVDGGHSWWYAGVGRFCHNLTEAFKYILNY